MIDNQKLLVICGPTGIGKTSLAIKLAKKFGGEIVSADSRQVYKGMDIGTGKDLDKFSIFKLQFSIGDKKIGYYEIDGVKTWLLDIVEPDYQFSVADYLECADLVIKNIRERKKLPILVGGTGFYIKAVVDGIETIGIKPDWELRKILGYQDIKTLREKLNEVDPKRLSGMNESDRNNPRRLIRAIEIARQKYTSEVSLPPNRRDSSTSEVKSFFIGLKSPYKELYERIDKRVEERVAWGVEKEIGQLLEKGYIFENSVLGTTIGYREWQPRFSNIQYPISNIIQRWKFDEHSYARRQMTWFKKILRQAQDQTLRLTALAQGKARDIHWFDVSKMDFKMKVEESVSKWYDRK